MRESPRDPLRMLEQSLTARAFLCLWFRGGSATVDAPGAEWGDGGRNARAVEGLQAAGEQGVLPSTHSAIAGAPGGGRAATLTYTHTHTHIYIYIYMNIYIHICIYIYRCIYTYIYMYLSIYLSSYLSI